MKRVGPVLGLAALMAAAIVPMTLAQPAQVLSK
jgi:hypothetical protein